MTSAEERLDVCLKLCLKHVFKVFDSFETHCQSNLYQVQAVIEPWGIAMGTGACEFQVIPS